MRTKPYRNIIHIAVGTHNSDLKKKLTEQQYIEILEDRLATIVYEYEQKVLTSRLKFFMLGLFIGGLGFTLDIFLR